MVGDQGQPAWRSMAQRAESAPASAVVQKGNPSDGSDVGVEPTEASSNVDDDADEMRSFGLIMASGQARSYAFEALDAAREHDFDRADELIEQSHRASLEAHNQQTKLLAAEAAGEHVPVDVMLVHAQDHLMTSMLAQELIEEIIYLHKEKVDKVA